MLVREFGMDMYTLYTHVHIAIFKMDNQSGPPVQHTLAVVQSFSPVQLFASTRTVACQASLSFTISWSLLKLMSIESVMPSNHLILCRPLLLLSSIFPHIRVFSMFSGRPDGRGVWGRMDTCICMTEPLHWLPETITTLFVNWLYPIENKKL